MLVVLDSTVIIDCLRGRPAGARVDALWDAGDTPATTTVNVEEVVRGMRQSEEAQTKRLLAGLEVLVITEDAAWQSGRWRSRLARQGITISQADSLIAAVTREHAARLATGNPRHFPMPAIDVEHWPVGE